MAKKEQSAIKPEFPAPGSSYKTADSTLRKFMGTAGVDSVYADPIQHGEVMIIPTAEVVAVVGFGYGHGFGGGESTEEGSEDLSGGEAGVGGGKTFSRPVAVVIADSNGVRVEPVRDTTKVVMAAVTAGGFMAAMLLRMISPKRALRELRDG
jgi:uncharacterized spore protein YtfJ